MVRIAPEPVKVMYVAQPGTVKSNQAFRPRSIEWSNEERTLR
jgi:hypothetical protein